MKSKTTCDLKAQSLDFIGQYCNCPVGKCLEVERKHEKLLLEKFMKEHFPFNELKKVGFFTKEMKGDYQAQANRICEYFGYETVFEYGAKEVSAHLSFPREIKVNEQGALNTEPFIHTFKSYLHD